jgi:anti-sigma regulatory factor (Ser/Thr protein kinase)
VDSLEVTLPGVPSSVPPARHFVERTLEAWGLEHLCWTAALLVSELATNAALHAGTDFRVVVERVGGDSGRLRVSVHDGSPQLPRARRTSDEATTGRGLRLVQELAAAWGVTPHPAGQEAGKAVWWELPTAHTADGADAEDAEADLDGLLAAFPDVDDVPEPAPGGPAGGRPALALAAPPVVGPVVGRADGPAVGPAPGQPVARASRDRPASAPRSRDDLPDAGAADAGDLRDRVVGQPERRQVADGRVPAQHQLLLLGLERLEALTGGPGALQCLGGLGRAHGGRVGLRAA